MAKVAFNVSARTARLIGRENVAHQDGAMIELIKNTYDANASQCVIVINAPYPEIPVVMSRGEYMNLFEDSEPKPGEMTLKKIVQACYKENQIEGYYDLNLQDDDNNIRIKMATFFNLQSTLWVIDNGDGMTSDIIQNHWMTIGTNNKEHDFVTPRLNRIKSGAKGIGRFALDRLGLATTLITKPNPETHTKENGDNCYTWGVSWEDFEKEGVSLNEVYADFESYENSDYQGFVKGLINGKPDDVKTENYPCVDNFHFGTAIQIKQASDKWDSRAIGVLFRSLGILLPPEGSETFNLYLLHVQEPDKYGKLRTSPCNDFDYKISAFPNKNGKIDIEIARKEYDISLIDRDLFRRDGMSTFPYDQKTFEEGKYTVSRTLEELVPGLNKDSKLTLSSIGSFELDIYFLKRNSNTDESEKFFYKSFSPATRKKWLNTFGGITVFRDNFRVRPYGEKGTSQDWLGLGARAASSPAGVAKKGGGWRVRPYNTAGTLRLTRKSNIHLNDKSSREGIVENQHFELLKQLIIGIIHVFEEDRAHIAQEMAKLYLENNSEALLLEQVRKYADEVNKKNKASHGKGKAGPSEEEVAFASAFTTQNNIIDDLKENQKLLRSLATTGVATASFAHELNHVKRRLGNRQNRLEKRLRKLLPSDANIPSQLNPYLLMNQMREDDENIQHWLNFAVSSVKQDKRTRKKVLLKKYFEYFSADWKTIFDSRGASIELNIDPYIELRCQTLDLDSIFNNLVINSLDAFVEKGSPAKRVVYIKAKETDKFIQIEYHDSGPGLSTDISDKNKVFDCFFSTKRDAYSGEVLGTGMGMWIIKTTIEDYNGQVKILNTADGFGIRMNIPRLYTTPK